MLVAITTTTEFKQNTKESATQSCILCANNATWKLWFTFKIKVKPKKSHYHSKKRHVTQHLYMFAFYLFYVAINYSHQRDTERYNCTSHPHKRKKDVANIFYFQYRWFAYQSNAIRKPPHTIDSCNTCPLNANHLPSSSAITFAVILEQRNPTPTIQDQPSHRDTGTAGDALNSVEKKKAIIYTHTKPTYPC